MIPKGNHHFSKKCSKIEKITEIFWKKKVWSIPGTNSSFSEKNICIFGPVNFFRIRFGKTSWKFCMIFFF